MMGCRHFVRVVVIAAICLAGSRAAVLFPSELLQAFVGGPGLALHRIPVNAPDAHLERNVRNLPRASEFSIYNSIWDFTLDLVKKVQIASDQSPNSVFSPLSITSALSMLLRGASKQTYEELKVALQYPAPISDDLIKSEWRTILNTLKSGELGVSLNVASAVFHKIDYHVKNDFRNDVNLYYKGDIFGIDFESEQYLINDWIRDATYGRIQQIYDTPLPQSTKMVVANAVYFHGLWKYPFSKDFTRQDFFDVTQHRKIQVPMMVNIVNIPYAESTTLGCKIINMPYEDSQTRDGPEVGMFFILPDESGEAGLESLESQLTRENLHDLINSMETKLLNLHLPRVKVEQTIQLKPALQALNVSAMFNPVKANFSRISAHTQGIFVDNVIHKTVVKITESGTEAAAATAVTLDRSGTTLAFKANRPFLFFIWHKDDTVLFWGRVVEPKSVIEN